MAPKINMVDIYSRLPLIYVFMSGIGFSIQTLIVKLLFERGYRGSFECVFTRGVLQLLLSSLFIYFDPERRANKGPPLFGSSSFVKWMLFFRSVVGYAGITFSFLSVEYIPIGDSTTLTMLSPVFASIGSFFALGEPWRLPEFAAAVLSLTGAALIAKPSFFFGVVGSETSTPAGALGVFFGLVSAVGAGAAYVFIRILGTTAKMPWANVCFAQSLSQIFLTIPCLYFFGQSRWFDVPWFDYCLIGASGVVGAFSQVAMTVGMQREKSASATGMRMSDVVFGFIWQAAFTSDAISWLSVLGAVLVSSGVLTIVIFKQVDSAACSSAENCSKSSHSSDGGGDIKEKGGDDGIDSDSRTDLEITTEDVEMVRTFHDQKTSRNNFFDLKDGEESRKLITLSHSTIDHDDEEINLAQSTESNGRASLSYLRSIISARLRRAGDSTISNSISKVVNKSKFNLEIKSVATNAIYTSLSQHDNNLADN